MNDPSSRGEKRKRYPFLGLLKLLKESCGRCSSAGIGWLAGWLAGVLPLSLPSLPSTLHTPATVFIRNSI